jgi:methylated-DNA-[protein]-cysteine S-methyltransferase
MTTLFARTYESPYGGLLIAVDESGALVRLMLPNEVDRWPDEIQNRHYDVRDDAGQCALVVAQLDEYFAGKRRTFDLVLKPEGTAFQVSVWNALQTIPYGTTISYKTLAEKIGNPSAVRAVGGANGANRIPIIIPCHRVIGADGTLTGFGGGIELKAQLLKLEGIERLNVSVEKITQAMLF